MSRRPPVPTRTYTPCPHTTRFRARLYAWSYFKLYADGKLVLDRWRQNWNPWFHNVELAMTAGKPVAIRIEWEPNAGYMAFVHNGPLPAPDRHSLWMTSDVAKGVDYYVTLAGRSEEHTSELQSLMRISYAVFCLKHKTIKPTNR